MESGEVLTFPKKMRSVWYLRILQWGIVLAIFFYMGNMVRENWEQLKEYSFSFRPFLVVLSTAIFAFSYFVQSWAWHFITVKLGIALSFGENLQSWFYSQLGKYLPGKIWLLLGRFYLYRSRGRSKISITLALYFETIISILAAGVLFLVSMILFEEAKIFHPGHSVGWLVLLLVFILIFLHPRVLKKILDWIFLIFKEEPPVFSVTYLHVLIVLLVCILAWLVGGVGFYLFVASIHPVAPRYFLFLTGAMAFSSILGLMAIFAPSGLGVREGALVYLLSLVVPVPIAVIISILTRVWMTLIEIGLIGVVYLVPQIRRHSKEKDPYDQGQENREGG